MTDMELAEEIRGLIFDAIKHGDEKHQAWLHDKSHELAPQIIAALRRGPERQLKITPTHEAADVFWKYWRENGETHKHGYYESTWGAINAALSAAEAEGRKPCPLCGRTNPHSHTSGQLGMS